MTFKVQKYICCTLDLTIATRTIAFIGLAISMILMTVLINDKFYNDFNKSRKTALAFGLDWQHFHTYTRSTHEADPEGKMISIIVIFYSIIFLITNLILFLASILYKQSYCIPWLVCEFLGCCSKLGALIFHLHTDPQNLSDIFVAGSIVYVVLTVWWWLVVFKAQQTWKYKKKEINDNLINTLNSTTSNFRETTPSGYIEENLSVIRRESYINATQMTVDSPEISYRANQWYAMI